MNVLVALEQRYLRTPEGAIWTHGVHAYDFWTRYLSVFENVKVLARVLNVASVLPGCVRADGPGVTFCPVPHYIGPWQFLRKAIKVRRAVSAAVEEGDAIIMRVSGHIGNCLEPLLSRAGRPYGLEVVADPYDGLSKGAVKCPFRPFFQWWFTRLLRRQCRRAAGVAYVTERALQMRYPCAEYSVGMSDVQIPDEALVRTPDVFATHYSSVEIRGGDTVESGRTVAGSRRRFHVITVVSLAQKYKATDVLILAIADCIRSGLDLSLDVVGDGRHRPELERLASRLGVSDRIRFLGQLPAGAPVRAQLDRADLFVLASRTEGLPRAMIEAMARALPCIGSTVGGIPELLAAEDLVPPGDVRALASKLREALSSGARLSEMSARNLAKAQEYRNNVLDRRRRMFFDHIRRSTEAWLGARRRALQPQHALSVDGNRDLIR